MSKLTTKRATTVILADDHAVVRDGLRLVLEAREDITVVADVADGREAVRRTGELKPDVVVMSHIDDDFIAQFWISSRQQGQDIARLFLADIAVQCDRQCCSERDGPKIALLSPGTQFVEIVTGQAGNLLSRLFGNPSAQFHLWVVIVRQLKLLAGPGCLHHLERIPGRR